MSRGFDVTGIIESKKDMSWTDSMSGGVV